MEPVVVKGLRKSFGAQPVLKGIDLTVNKGEILAILGKSGTGKSVFLRLLIGLIQKLRQERNVTSIVVTHDMHGAHSDRLVMLKDGNISISGTFEDLEKSKDPFVEQLLSDAA